MIDLIVVDALMINYIMTIVISNALMHSVDTMRAIVSNVPLAATFT